ncbi:hypothetical protein WA026_001696 [Henosepilachna vigintioctopunctata]|uniref:Carboxylic ester hydrolase n=1 Tax=Henosepilachna vigintioctopunctata TaxID=420089 RepID=A0AAW1UU75_9CUCU
MILNVLILVLIVVCQGSCSSDPLVNTTLGTYRGSILRNTFQKTIFSFRGIKYAEAPIDKLRFKSPVPVKKHLEIYNATEDKPLCPQPTDDPISEDCLYLNVYTSELPKDGKIHKKAVIVFLHAGGYYSGTGRSNILGPQYFLNQDIVLVTLNYRLGTLGFLSTGDKEATGNYGLKDQVAALKWVRSNIEYFGGDKNCITLFGYSAGAMSVNLHLMSPMSKGLFHRAIIGSLSSLGQLPIGRSQLELAKRQARLVGCPDDTSKNIVDCLRGKSAMDLGNSLDNMFEFLNDPVLIWKPVIEEDYGQERFLTDHPIKLVLDGKFQNIPILSGITSDEFGFRGLDLELNANMFEKLDKEWEKYAPIIFLYERHTDRSKEISKGLRSFYFGDKKLDNSTSIPLTQIYNEGLTGFATNRAVKILSEKSSQEVYYYRFSYRGKYSHYTSSTSNTTAYGPVHHDDLIYLFYISVLFPEFKKTDNDFRTVQKLTTMWANFAKTGKPIPRTCGRLDYVQWEPFNLATQKYMDIGNTLKLKQRLYSERYAVWEKLFPISRYNETENISY